MVSDMDIKEILKRTDHTNLSVTATSKDIELLCNEAERFGVASVCVAPCFVSLAKEILGESVAVCTVIGFPNGYNTTRAKVFETKEAIKNGAQEIDMVINQGMVKDKNFDGVLAEIKAVREAAAGKILKVIVETCHLDKEEKIRLCRITREAGADYIKTSTGFGKKGASFSDVELFSRHITGDMKIKAAGGISTLEDAKRFIELGADRLGTSRIIKLVGEKI